MAFKFNLGMELTALSIIDDCLSNMTNSNIDDELTKKEGLTVSIPDSEALDNNLKNGFIAIVMMSCYYESFLNTLLRDYLGYSPDGSLMRGSTTGKIEVIFNGNEDQLAKIKDSANWRDAQRVFKLRNHLIHFKNNMQSEYSSYPAIQSWKIGDEILGDFFLKSEIEKCSVAVRQLVIDIAKTKGLTVLPETNPIFSDMPYCIGYNPFDTKD